MPEQKSSETKKSEPHGDVWDGLSVEAFGGHLKLKHPPRFSSKQITLTAVSFIGACGVVYLAKSNAQPIAYGALLIPVLVSSWMIWQDRKNEFTRIREAPRKGALQSGIDPGG